MKCLTLILITISFAFAKPGDLLWRYKTGGNVSNPCIDIEKNALFITSHDNYLLL